MAFPNYNPDATCPKCGESHVAKRYVAAGAVGETYVPEHMARTCTSCSYQWDEALPTDQQKAALVAAKAVAAAPPVTTDATP